jgi:hypothetical protein
MLPRILTLILRLTLAFTLTMSLAAYSAEAAQTHPQHLRSRRNWELRHRAHAAIVGRNQISVIQAPWQVVIGSVTPASGIPTCDGAILDATHILTTAYCLVDPTNGQYRSPKGLLVIAGTSNISRVEPEAQRAEVAAVRIHPYYDYVPGRAVSEDDIAVLELSKALDLNETTVRAVRLPSAGSHLPEGTQVDLAGFGDHDSETASSGQLYSLGMHLVFSRFCGGEADAVFLCGTAPTGSVCHGDSGSGLVVPGPTPILIGVAETFESQECRGALTYSFTSLAAPEIQDFIDGSESPPRAPRGGGISTFAVPQVGNSMTCGPGGWSGSPTFTYLFVDSATGQVLQSGPEQSYQLGATDVGRSIYCEVEASNAGGVGLARTVASGPIMAAPSAPSQAEQPYLPPPVPQALPQATGPSTATGHASVVGDGANFKVKDNSSFVKLECDALTTCTGKVTLTAASGSKSKARMARVVMIGIARFSIPAAETGRVKIRLNTIGRDLLRVAHGSLGATLSVVSTAPGQSSATRDVDLTRD